MYSYRIVYTEFWKTISNIVIAANKKEQFADLAALMTALCTYAIKAIRLVTKTKQL